MIAAQVAAQAADKKRQQGKKETPIWLMVRPPVPRNGEKKRETQPEVCVPGCFVRAL